MTTYAQINLLGTSNVTDNYSWDAIDSFSLI